MNKTHNELCRQRDWSLNESRGYHHFPTMRLTFMSMTIFVFAHSDKLKQVWNRAYEKNWDISKSMMILVHPRVRTELVSFEGHFAPSRERWNRLSQLRCNFRYQVAGRNQCSLQLLVSINNKNCHFIRVFLMKMLGTRYGSVGPDFSDSRDPIFSYFRNPMIIFSDSRDPIWNSRDPNRVPKMP